MRSKYKYMGKVHSVGSTQEFKSGFRKRTLVLKSDDGKYTNYAAFDFMKEKVSDLDKLRIGEAVEVEFYVEAHESQKNPGQWFSGNRAVSISRLSGSCDIRIKKAGGNADDEDEGCGDMPF